MGTVIFLRPQIGIKSKEKIMFGILKEAIKPRNLGLLVVGLIVVNGLLKLAGKFISPAVPAFVQDPVGTVQVLTGKA